jgi:hypothetical protein
MTNCTLATVFFFVVRYFSGVTVANFFSLNYRNIFVSSLLNFKYYFNIWLRRMNFQYVHTPVYTG